MSDPPIPAVIDFSAVFKEAHASHQTPAGLVEALMPDVSTSSWLLITSDSLVGATSVGWCFGGRIGTIETRMLNEQEHFFSSLIKSFAERPELLGNAGEGPGTDAVAGPDGLTEALLSAAST
jgi:hypothetical protein